MNLKRGSRQDWCLRIVCVCVFCKVEGNYLWGYYEITQAKHLCCTEQLDIILAKIIHWWRSDQCVNCEIGTTAWPQRHWSEPVCLFMFDFLAFLLFDVGQEALGGACTQLDTQCHTQCTETLKEVMNQTSYEWNDKQLWWISGNFQPSFQYPNIAVSGHQLDRRCPSHICLPSLCLISLHTYRSIASCDCVKGLGLYFPQLRDKERKSGSSCLWQYQGERAQWCLGDSVVIGTKQIKCQPFKRWLAQEGQAKLIPLENNQLPVLSLPQQLSGLSPHW